MAEKALHISQQQTKPIKIVKWKVTEGNIVSIGSAVLIFVFDGAAKSDHHKLKATQAGTVLKILAQEGAIIQPGEILCELAECTHPTIVNEMCAECGTDLRKNDVATSASVPMVHAFPDLKVSKELAKKLGDADKERLLRDRKLVLLVDLDQTLIHTTNDNIPPNIKDVYHFQLHGPHSPWYHTRFRPRTHEFLDNIHPLFELHICTFGARNYAHMIAAFLDPEQKFFCNRILSRDECFDPTSKKANLKALFPCGDNMVCIIDDREDVWSNASNLIHVKPYHFFQHTGDINAPPGLDKHEDDNKVGVDLTKIKRKPKGKVKSGSARKKIVAKKKIMEKKKDAEVPVKKEDEKPVENVGDGKSEENNSSNNTTEAKTEETKEVEDEKGKAVEENNEVKRNGEDIASDAKMDVDQKTEIKGEDVPSNENNDTKTDSEEKTETEKPEKPVPENAESIKETNRKTPTKATDKKENESKSKEDNLVEIEDPDDYLLYLEDILKKIHMSFYEEYDKLESGNVPDLKSVIPYVRGQVLKDCKLVFSGLVPTHIKLEQSKAYQIARSLGAEVTQEIGEDCTHLVAVRPGTAKVNAGKRKKSLKIVTPDWLWSCAERWEHIDEKIFPLNSRGSKNRHPPPHCSSPEHIASYPEGVPAMRKQRTPSGRFMDTINPLMSFSTADIADMDKEVEDILDDESDSSEEEEPPPALVAEPQVKLESGRDSSTSEDSLSADYPKGHKRKRDDDSAQNPKNIEDEVPSTRFKRGEMVDDELDMEQTSQESNGSVEEPDEVDDGEWNMMGAALEREFLSNN